MFKFLKGITRSKVLKVGLAVILATVMAVSGITVSDKLSPQSDSSFQVGIGQKVITIGTVVYAAGTVDYTTDGVADDVQFQAAIDALPATGGKISVLTGNYVFSATVTRAIANVTIDGNGLSTNFTYDGVNPIFTAGGNRWVFANFVTDAGSVNLGATTGWQMQNVLLGATYYAYRSPYGQSVFNDATVASFTDSGLTSGRVPIAGVGGLLGDSANLTWTNPSLQVGGANVTRTASYVVAASNAPAHVRAQADYVTDGTADQVEIQAAINALTVGRVTIETVKVSGNFSVSARITLPSYTRLDLSEARLTLANDTNDRFISNADRVGGNNYIVIEGGYIDGNKNGQSAIGPTDVWGNAGALDFRNVDNLVVRGATIVNAWAAGIETTYVTNALIEGNRIDNSADDGVGINDNTSYAVVANNIITNAGQGVQYGAPAGVEVQDGSRYVTVMGNTINGTANNGVEVSIHAGATSNYGIIVSGNTVTNSSGVGIAVIGVGVVYNENVLVVDNSIIDGATAGIYTRLTNLLTISGNIVNVSGDAIDVDTGNDITISSNVVSDGTQGIDVNSSVTMATVIGNASTNSSAEGIRVNAPYTTVNGNTVQASGTIGISVGAANVAVSGNAINGSASHGVYLGNNADYSQVSNNVLVNNVRGVQTDSADYTILAGNTVRDNLYQGILSNSSFSIILGNLVVDNGRALAASRVGIAVNQDSNIIRDNQVRDTGAGSQQWGIYLYAGADSNRVEGNVLVGNASGQLGNSGASNTFFRNIGYVTENSGTATILSGNISVVVNHGLATTATSVLLAGTHTEVRDAIVTNITSTQFTITASANVTANRDVYWRAVVGAGN